jgi:hypothetical protein
MERFAASGSTRMASETAGFLHKSRFALPKRRIEDCLGNTFPKRTILDAHSAPVADLGAPPWWRQKAAVGPPTGLDQKSVAGRFKSHVTHQDRVVPGSRRGLLS